MNMTPEERTDIDGIGMVRAKNVEQVVSKEYPRE